MSEQVEARVTGPFFHASDGQYYYDGDTCRVSPETIERHYGVLEEAGEADATESGSETEDSADESPSNRSESVTSDESSYSRDELEEMSRSELQRLASDAETDEVSGRSGNDAIIDYFADEE